MRSKPTIQSQVLDLLSGRVLDVGYAANPLRVRPEAVRELAGLDIQKAHKPTGYDAVAAANLNTDAFPFADGMFDTVYAGEVIEHVTNPIRFLTECNRVLVPDGRCVLTTPNPYYFRRVLEELFLGYFKAYDDHHISLFTRYSMRAAAKRAQFSVSAERGTILRVPLVGRTVAFRRFPSLTDSIVYILDKAGEFREHSFMLDRVAGSGGPKFYEASERLF